MTIPVMPLEYAPQTRPWLQASGTKSDQQQHPSVPDDIDWDNISDR